MIRNLTIATLLALLIPCSLLAQVTDTGINVDFEFTRDPVTGVISIVSQTQTDDSTVVASILPSRTTCASPCTVVFSAENTTAVGLDEQGVWSQLSYHWDFDTNETDTYGSLYNQTYTYVSGDTAFESGHVPMVTKTFLCATGTCAYNVGMRAQNANGDWGDTFQTITVTSESAQWNAANTVCISNTLSTGADWTVYDKPCPAGATKQSITLDYDQYNGKLVLFKKGDVFNQNIATLPSQSNFKIGVFGNTAEARPEIDGEIILGITNISGAANAPTIASYTNIDNSLVAAYGWPSNIYVEGIKLGEIAYPMSYQHVGIHDIDMDRRAYATGGRIEIIKSPTWCVGNSLDCFNVPFAKGGYISSVNLVGESLSASGGPTVQIVQTECPMVNFLGVVDVQVQRAREHNLRIAGFYRINIMRSFFRGEHELPGKQKVTLRNCLRSGVLPSGNWDDGAWQAESAILPPGYRDDVEGRTRADIFPTGTPATGGTEFIHESRYGVVAYNQLGDADGIVGTTIGGTMFQTNVLEGDVSLHVDVIVAHNLFENEPARTSDFSALIQGSYHSCIDNTYAAAGTGCYGATGSVGLRINPAPTPAPLVPGSN